MNRIARSLLLVLACALAWGLTGAGTAVAGPVGPARAASADPEGPSSPGSPKKDPPDALSEFRALASSLGKKGLGADTSLALEYLLNRQGDACAGAEPELRLRLYGNGRLELMRTRSFGESERVGPGSFVGKAKPAEWDSVFARAAAMQWVVSPLGLPMPGMSESNHVIVLHHGGRTARFDFSGSIPPGQAAIAAGLGRVSALMETAVQDTLWWLGLEAGSARIRNGGLDLQSVWRLRGRQAMRFKPPVPGKAPQCGALGLRWMSRARAEQGTTPLPPEWNWSYPKAAKTAGAWKDLKPGESVSLAFAFPLPKPLHAPREGRLMQTGFAIAMAGSKDTVAVITLYSPDFPF